MRTVPAVLFVLLLFALPAVAAPPQGMAFNGAVSGDVKGPVRGVSADGPGVWAAVAVGDDPLNLQDVDLVGFSLESQSRRWDATDLDGVTAEGHKLVAVSNGTGSSPGPWLVTVNNTVSNALTVYQTNGQGPGGNLGRPVWQLDAGGVVNDVDINADGKLIGAVTGTAAGNKSIYLLRNNFFASGPRVLYRGTPDVNQFSSVIQFNTMALSHNLTSPSTQGVQFAAYMVVGATVTSTTGVAGKVYVLQTSFATSIDNPVTTIVQEIDTATPVVVSAITSDGEYAVVGTDAGTVYLLSVSEALQKRGVQQIQPGLGPWQQSLGTGIRAVAIAPFGGEFLGVGTDGGDVFLFRNQRNAFGSEGAQAVSVASANVNTPACGSSRLSGAVFSMAMSDFGDALVVGAKNGVMAFEAAAYGRYFRPRIDPLEPAWCVPFGQGDVGTGTNDGVLVDVSADARRVFAGSGHRVFGYNNFYCLKLEPEGGPVRPGQPGQRVQWSLTVRNDGSLFDRVNLSISGPLEGWQFQLSNASLNLMPGKSQTIQVNATSPQDIAPGNFSLVFTASPERASRAPNEMKCGTNQNTVNLRLDMGQQRRVEIRPPTSTLVATAGSPNTFPITIHNSGNAVDTFRVSARIPDPEQAFKSPGSEWLLRVDPVEVAIGPNSDGTVDLVVTPQAQRGDRATVEISVEAAVPSPDGAFIGDVKQVEVAVEPSYNGDIALVETKDYRAEPGQLIFINYTIKNLGNSRDIFLVKNKTEPANAPGFLLQLGDQRFELRRQNDQKVVRLSVFVQQGVQPGESVRIIVDLFSEGLQRDNPGSDGQVDSLPVTVTVVPKARRGLPFAEEPLVLLGVVLVAVLARHRRA